MSADKIEESEIISRITESFPGAVVDVAGEDCSFEVYIITDSFSDMNTLQRQKAVLGLFKDEIKTGKLHALSVKAKTSQEQSSNSGLVQINM